MNRFLITFFSKLCPFVLLLSFNFLFSQEKIGVTTDNFLPVKQVGVNPALIVDQKFFLSVNVVGAHIFGRSNVINYANSSLLPKTDIGDPIFDEPNKFARGYIAAEVSGPSATLNYKKNAFGIHTAIRGYGSMNRVPSILVELINDENTEQVSDGTYIMKNGRFKTMSWGEIGVSYGRILRSREYELISAGVTINRLYGIQQSSLNIKNGTVNVVQSKGLIGQAEGSYSYTDAQFGSGKGWGMDVGITYKGMFDNVNKYLPHSRNGGCKVADYRYRIGVSLMDLGYIRYRDDARYAKLQEQDTLLIDDLFEGNEEVLGKDGSKYTAFLPTALSIQGDFYLADYVYLNARINQRLSFRNSFGVERSNLIAVAPRFESRWITASIPLTLSNYIVPQAGFYLRLGYLAIGSDHILPFIRRGDLRAVDLYFNLNFFIRNSPECRVVDNRSIPWLCPSWGKVK
jgi:hypothetical protein